MPDRLKTCPGCGLSVETVGAAIPIKKNNITSFILFYILSSVIYFFGFVIVVTSLLFAYYFTMGSNSNATFIAVVFLIGLIISGFYANRIAQRFASKKSRPFGLIFDVIMDDITIVKYSLGFHRSKDEDEK
jgi:MFS family permease